MTRDAGRHSTRLSALFVAAILIPGCVLAYFSIQNVSSQKELAERRLLEEEQRMAAKLGLLAQDELLRSAGAFFTAADKVYPDLHRVSLPADVGRYVAQPFALDGSGGRFLWPRYAVAESVQSTASETTRFRALFASAEREEFAVKNLSEAARLYREAARAARHNATRAAAINGLARVLAKSGRTEQAATQYQILLEQYSSADDDDGISFARYALHQLMRVSSSDPTVASRLISRVLSHLENGQMPLTDQTEPLLQEVENWLNRRTESEAADDTIPVQLGIIRGRLAFMVQAARPIASIQSRNPDSGSPQKLGPFEAVAVQVAGNPALFVLRRDANRSVILGCQVAVEHLRTTLLEHCARTPGSLARIPMRGMG